MTGSNSITPRVTSTSKGSSRPGRKIVRRIDVPALARSFHRLRKEAAEKGYDPDKWFGNVEWIVRARVSREPVRYVGNIYKYYVAFAENDEAVGLGQNVGERGAPVRA